MAKHTCSGCDKELADDEIVVETGCTQLWCFACVEIGKVSYIDRLNAA